MYYIIMPQILWFQRKVLQSLNQRQEYQSFGLFPFQRYSPQSLHIVTKSYSRSLILKLSIDNLILSYKFRLYHHLSTQMFPISSVKRLHPTLLSEIVVEPSSFQRLGCGLSLYFIFLLYQTHYCLPFIYPYINLVIKS